MRTMSLVGLTLMSLMAVTGAEAQNAVRPDGGLPAAERPLEMQDIEFEQRLNTHVPVDLAFVDEDGQAITLADYFNRDRPIVLVPVYYECPMLCTQVLNGLVGALGVMSFTVGQEFDVVVFSFDPKETPSLARDKKAAYVDRYARPASAPGWHFLTGSPASIERLVQEIGFRYQYDPSIDQYSHMAGIAVLTPEGYLSKYFFGIEFSPRDLRFALIEASAHRIGTPVDRAVMWCYHYDPSTGKYGVLTMRLVRAGGVLTLTSLAAFWLLMWRRRERGSGASQTSDAASRM